MSKTLEQQLAEADADIQTALDAREDALTASGERAGEVYGGFGSLGGA